MVEENSSSLSLWDRIDPAVFEVVDTTKSKNDSNRKRKLISRKLLLVADFIGSFFWIYLIVKAFVFDFDSYLFQKFAPGFYFLSQYRLFIFLGAVLLIAIFFKRYYLFFLYVILFPLIIVCWKVPRALYKARSWVLVLGVLEVVFSLFKNFRFKIVKNSITIFLVLIVVISSNVSVLTIASLGLLVVLLIDLTRLAYFSFKTSSFFKFHSTIIKKVGSLGFAKSTITIKSELDKSPGQKLSKELSSLVRDRLQTAVLLQRTVRYWAHQLEKYRESKVSFLLNIFSYFMFVLQALVFLTLINYALYKIDPTNFSFLHEPTLIRFFTYTFSSFLVREMQAILANSDIAFVLWTIPALMSVLLVGVGLIDYMTSSRRNKNSKDLQNAINDVNEEGKRLDGIIKNEFELTTEEAISKLKELRSGMLSIIYWFSSQLPDERRK